MDNLIHFFTAVVVIAATLAGISVWAPRATWIKISAITLPEGVHPTITDRDFTVATVAAPSVLKTAEEEAEEAAAAAELLEEGAEGIEGEEGETPAEGGETATESKGGKD